MSSEDKINQVVYIHGSNDGLFEFHFFFKGLVQYHKNGEIDGSRFERSDDQQKLEIKEFLSELKVISLDADHIKIGHNKSNKVWDVTIRQDKTNKLNWFGRIAPTEDFFDFAYEHGDYSSNAGFEVYVEWIPWSEETKEKYPYINIPKPWPDYIGNKIIGQIVMAMEEQQKEEEVISHDPVFSIDEPIEKIPYFKKVIDTLGKKVLKELMKKVKQALEKKTFKDLHPIDFTPTPEMIYESLPSIGFEKDVSKHEVEIPTAVGMIKIKAVLRLSPEIKQHSVVKAEVVKKELKLVTSNYGNFSSHIKITDKGIIEASNQINLGKYKVSYGVVMKGVPTVTCTIASKPFEVSSVIPDSPGSVSDSDIQAVKKTLEKYRFASSIKITVSLIPKVPLDKPSEHGYEKMPETAQQKIPEEVFKPKSTLEELWEFSKTGGDSGELSGGWIVAGVLLAIIYWFLTGGPFSPSYS